MRIELPPVPPEPVLPDLQSQPLEARTLAAEYLAARREAQAALRRVRADAGRQGRGLRRLRFPVSRIRDRCARLRRRKDVRIGTNSWR